MHMMRTTESTDRRLTYQDYLRFPDDGNRHELIDGAEYVTPMPALRHQRIVGEVHGLIWQHLKQYGGGEILLSPFPVVFSLFDVVEPDLLYISDARRSILTTAHVQGSPDLVVEVLSPSTRRRDAGIKLRLYGRAGVTEYWMVDPASDTIRVYRRVKGSLTLVVELNHTAGSALRSPLLPGLSLPLDQVFGR